MQRRTLLATLAATTLASPVISTSARAAAGMITVRYGSSRIARAMLVAPTTPFALKRPDNPDGVDRAAYDAMIAALEADPLAYFVAGMPGFLGRTVEPEMADWALSIARQASVPALVKCMGALSETDFRADMAAFTMPTLIVSSTAPATRRRSCRTRVVRRRRLPTATCRPMKARRTGCS